MKIRKLFIIGTKLCGKNILKCFRCGAGKLGIQAKIIDPFLMEALHFFSAFVLFSNSIWYYCDVIVFCFSFMPIYFLNCIRYVGNRFIILTYSNFWLNRFLFLFLYIFSFLNSISTLWSCCCVCVKMR